MNELEQAMQMSIPQDYAKDARVVHPLKSPLLKGHDPWADLPTQAQIAKRKNAQDKMERLAAKLDYKQRLDRKQSLKIVRAAERRNRIIQHLAMSGDWIESKRIDRDLSIDQHTLYADLVLLRNSHVVEYKECRRPDNRGSYKAYRVSA